MVTDDNSRSTDAHRTPFVLGKPIKNPVDFYGRQPALRKLFDAVLNGQLMSVVGEHRCGNTSVIYQMRHPDVRREYLSPQEDRGLLFALVSCQLAADGPPALFRRIARTLRRADPQARIEFGTDIDRRWMEDYLEDLADRGMRLVLLMDEFEVLAGFRHSFWQWFEGLVNEYDLAIVATSRMDLGEFRTRHGSGPPFFNLFGSVFVGSFCEETVERFLAEKSEITEFDFSSFRDRIESLAGRFPYYMQVASALYYFQTVGDSQVSAETVEVVEHEFKSRTLALFEDAWQKLPEDERDALTWILLDSIPDGADEHAYHSALKSLDRRGYYLDGRIFSTAFAAFVRDQLKRISLNPDTGKARVEHRLVELPDESFRMLAFFLAHDGKVVSRDDVAAAVWPEFMPADIGDAQLQDTFSKLRASIEPADGSERHLEQLGGLTFRFRNTGYP